MKSGMRGGARARRWRKCMSSLSFREDLGRAPRPPSLASAPGGFFTPETSRWEEEGLRRVAAVVFRCTHDLQGRGCPILPVAANDRGDGLAAAGTALAGGHRPYGCRSSAGGV